MDPREDHDYFLRHYGEHLEPDISPWTDPLLQGQGADDMRSYYRDLLEAVESATKPIRDRLLHPQMASLFCNPTYEGTWALRLAGEPKKNFTLILAKYKYSRSPQTPETRVEKTVTTSRTLLPCRLAELVCDIWTRVLYGTRYPKGRRIGMCDGVMYHFAYWSEDTWSMTGETHSPPKTTVPGQLATLAKALKAYVEADGEAQQLVYRDIKAQVAAFPAEVE